MKTTDLADLTHVPSAYLSKVLQELNKAGIVQTQRGIKGGVMLAKDPKHISFFDIITAVDPIFRIDKCPLGFDPHDPELCPLHHKMDALLNMIEFELKSITLEQLTHSKKPNSPLCELPVIQ